MNPELVVPAKETLGNAGLELVRLYTGSAFELNAFDVTARSYAKRNDEFFLSTTKNIPESLQLVPEIDHGKYREELIEHYETEALRRACEDYLVRSVSVADAALEEIYDLALERLSPSFSEQKRQREVRSSWIVDDQGRTKIATYLVETAGLRSSPHKESTIDMVFDRYCEIRELRHALVHNRGQLSPKHLSRLAQLQNRLPEQMRQGTIAEARFVVDGVISMTMREMLILRKWFYMTIFGFLRESFEYSGQHGAGEA